MPHKYPRLRVVALIAAATALALGACSTDTPNSTGAATHALAIAVVTPPNSLDPAQLADGQQMYVWGSILDTLLYKKVKTGDLKPNAAESWQYNGDGTKLTLKIRKGMTFSTGTPVNAQAIAATMQRTMATPGVLQVKLAAVKSVTAVDDSTVLIEFKHFDPQFLPNLAGGAGAIGDPKTLADKRTATDPVGSGPYTLDTAATVPGSKYVLKKRNDYWNAAAYPFTTVTVRALPDPTASFNALQAGEINAATVNSQLVGKLDKSTFTITKVDAQAIMFLDILDRKGAKWPALGDVRVRQAINYAIDREGILKGILQGNGKVTDQIFSPFGKVNDPALDVTYPHDPAKGKALVQEAGYAGTTFKIPSTFLSTSFESSISQAFKDIGLGLDWVSVPPQQTQSALLSGQYGLSFQILGFNNDAADAAQHYAADGYANPQHYQDATTDRLLKVINTTVDFDKALPAYQELNAYAVKQAFEAPIVFTGSTWATSKGVAMLDDGKGLSTTRQFGLAQQ
ncbi:ABC transporter substrate-binding protein [Actinoplanes subtropicus]|uniref:ABC transporter substrate-binding protein n=1 Tax=Actinoplanes subtropicus TaxID=543632 RepID=UPI0004C3D1D2|nr:ABC transporter substrate-binding protein [Actinoplanes subtropicus]